MRRSHMLFVLTTFVLPTPLLAASVFDGTWKQDPSTAKFAGTPMVMILKDGMYSCPTCSPAIHIKADGTDQAVTGHPAYDSIALNAIDAHTVHEVEKLGGKVAREEDISLAPDGQSAVVTWRDLNSNSAKPVTGTTNLVRVSARPAGGHALSGSWAPKSLGKISEDGILTTLKVADNKVSMSLPTGETYGAVVNGADAPFSGDPRVQTVSVKMPTDHEIIENDKRGGKIVSVVDMVVEADGKTMKMSFANKISGRTASFTAYKQ